MSGRPWESRMRLGRLVAGGLVAGALAGFVAGLVRPRPRGVLPGLAPIHDPSIAGSAAPDELGAPVPVEAVGPGAAGPEPVGPEPVGPEPVGRETVGRETVGPEPPQHVEADDGHEAHAKADDDGGWLVGENGEHFTVSAGRSRPQGEGAG